MTPAQFAEQLEKEGFDEIVTVERPAGGALDEHAHPFEARALVLDGEIVLVISGKDFAVKAGEIFRLPADLAHAERYGPAGVRYLVGRRR